MKFSKLKIVSSLSLVSAMLISCSNKSNFSSKDAPSTKLDKAVGSSNSNVSKAGDELQRQLNELKAKVAEYYKEFVEFKLSVDVRFAKIDSKMKEQNLAVIKEIARIDAKVDSLSEWRDSSAKPLFEQLLASTSSINNTIKEMNLAHVALSDKLVATDKRLTSGLDGLTVRMVIVEEGLDKAKLDILANMKTLETSIEKARSDATSALNAQKVILDKRISDESVASNAATKAELQAEKLALELKISLVGDSAAAALNLQKNAMADEMDRIEEEMVAFKNEAATKFATKSELGEVQKQLNTLNQTVVSMYSEMKVSDQGLADKIQATQNDVNGLRGQFMDHVQAYKQSLIDQKAALGEKIALVRAEMIASDSSNTTRLVQLQNALVAQAEDFGSKLNTQSVALNSKIEELTGIVGENKQEVVDATMALREVQSNHQQAIAGLGQEVSNIVGRLTRVEDVARRAAQLSESNTVALSLMSADFETQKAAVASRFGLVETEVAKVKDNLEAFKTQTAQKFDEVRRDAAALVANLDSKMQTQFGGVAQELARKQSQLDAQNTSLAQLTLANGDMQTKFANLQERQEYQAKVSAFDKEFSKKIDGSMLKLKDVVVALANVESQYVVSMGLVPGSNKGDFDPLFRSQVSTALGCGVTDPLLDFANAGGVDYFNWMARQYSQDLVLGVRSGSAGVDGIFFGEGSLVGKDSVSFSVAVGLTKLEAKTSVPMNCLVLVSDFAGSAHKGSTAASIKLRQGIVGSVPLKASVAALKAKLASWQQSMTGLEAWIKSEMATIPGSNVEKTLADLSQTIVEKSKLVLDIADKRAELAQIADVSFQLAANSLGDDNYRNEMKANLEAVNNRLSADALRVSNEIKALASSQIAADVALRGELQAQAARISEQAASTTRQVSMLNNKIDIETAAGKETLAKLKTEMDANLNGLNGRINGVSAELGSVKQTAQQAAGKQAQGLESVFTILATMAARSGDTELQKIVAEASVNFNGKVPQVVSGYAPLISTVQHYFKGGDARNGSENVCLSLTPETIQRSAFDWMCNLNFRSFNIDQKIGTAKTAVIRTHGQFGFIQVKAKKANVWSWIPEGAAVAETWSKNYCVSEAVGDFCKSPAVGKLTKVAGAANPGEFGDRGVYDLNDSGDVFVSMVGGDLQGFNGYISVVAGRKFAANEAVPALYGKQEIAHENIKQTFLVAPEFRYIVGLYSPLVLEFSDSLRTLTPSEANVKFDLNGNGIKEQTGWINGKTTGFLALPKADGTVVNGEQLFGQATKLLGSQSRAENGYLALAQYDADGSGFIDAKDPVFKKLVVWFDANQDGVAQKAELQPLVKAGVTKMAVRYQNVPAAQVVQGSSIIDSNRVPYTAQFWGPDACGAKGCSTYDVYFGASEISNARK